MTFDTLKAKLTDDVASTDSLRRKEAEVRTAKTEAEHYKYIASKQTLANLKNIPTFTTPLAQLNADDSVRLANAVSFLTPKLDHFVKLLPGDISVVFAPPGRGKSTLLANLVRQAIGEERKCLIITNEEESQDVVNRIACLVAGIDYIAFQNKRTPELTELVTNAGLKIMPFLTIVGQEHPDYVHSCEGIVEVIKQKGPEHGIVLVDYYNRINRSLKDPDMDDNKCQHQFQLNLNSIKRLLPPVVIFAQTRPGDADIHIRMMGRRSLLEAATTILELDTDVDNYTTRIVCHKYRFGKSTGKSLTLGFDPNKNCYVKPDAAFHDMIRRIQSQATMSAELDGDFIALDNNDPV